MTMHEQLENGIPCWMLRGNTIAVLKQWEEIQFLDSWLLGWGQ